MTGAAFLPVGRIERAKLKVTKGEESLLVEGDPDSAYEVRCGKCFSLLHWTSRDGYFGVPYGTLIDEPTLKPMYHQFVGSKAPWYEILDDLPQHTRVLPLITNQQQCFRYPTPTETLAQASVAICERACCYPPNAAASFRPKCS